MQQRRVLLRKCTLIRLVPSLGKQFLEDTFLAMSGLPVMARGGAVLHTPEQYLSLSRRLIACS